VAADGFIHLVEGTLEIRSTTGRTLRLEAGDSAHVVAWERCEVRAAGPDAARYVSAIPGRDALQRHGRRDAPAPLAQRRLGERLRALRQARGVTVAEAAVGSGLSASFVSLVEAGKSDISVMRLMTLTEFLGSSWLAVVGRPAPASGEIVRREEAFTWTYDPGVAIQPLPSSAQGGGDYHLTRYEIGAELRLDPAQRLLSGEVWKYVLDGAIAVDLGGAEPMRLTRGDSMAFGREHWRGASNAGSAPARVLIYDPLAGWP
jgi:transcriptional regulator with XRE-family HTH domain/quercetin dioxygenase-like cupin family protein